MIYFSIWDLFWRNNLLNYGIYTHISSVTLSVWLCLNFLCKFNLSEPKCMTRGMIFKALWIEEVSKSIQIWHNTYIPWQVPWFKDDQTEKQQRNLSTEAADATTGWVWWAPQAMVTTTVSPWWLWQLPPLPICLFFFTSFRLLHVLSNRSFDLVHKRTVFSCYIDHLFLHYHLRIP